MAALSFGVKSVKLSCLGTRIKHFINVLFFSALVWKTKQKSTKTSCAAELAEASVISPFSNFCPSWKVVSCLWFSNGIDHKILNVDTRLFLAFCKGRRNAFSESNWLGEIFWLGALMSSRIIVLRNKKWEYIHEMTAGHHANNWSANRFVVQ